MEPQQSPLYASYMTALGWDVKTIDGVNIFLKKFPLMGGMMKIHRPEKLPHIQKLLPLLHAYSVRKLVIEPVAGQNQNELSRWCRTMASHVSINQSPFLPTKTLRIDLTPKEEHIFKSFSEAKRRAVRRAQKNNLIVGESTNMDELIKVKNRSGGILGFIATTGIKQLWPIFAPLHAAIVLAQTPAPQSHVVGGVFLLFWDKCAYYWIAGATGEGKKLFAPTILVWEAIKLAKRRKCTQFDFVGVWDERIPKKNTSWHGFTKFKEGFGGKTLYYPLAINSMPRPSINSGLRY